LKFTGFEEDLVVRVRTSLSRYSEAVPDLDTFDSWNRHHCVGNPCIHPPIPLGVGAKTDRNSISDNLEDST
jgi:hypothetical protein